MQVLSPPQPRNRVGFIVPRWTVDPVGDRQGIPFRCITVAGALYQSGLEVVWFDQEPDLQRTDRTAALRDALRDCQLVFFWMNELTPATQLANSLAIAKALKQWRPELRLVLGGGFCAILPEHWFFTASPFDYVLRGYGEEEAPLLADADRSGRGLDAVPGLVWKNGEWRGNPVASRRRLHAEHLALYRELDLSEYVQRGGIFGNGEPTFTLGTGRGCEKHCTFCYWTNHETSLVPPEQVVGLVADLSERYGVKQFHLAELDAFASRSRPLAIAAGFAKRAPGCTWFTLGSPIDVRRLSDDDMDRLAAGGMTKLEMGTESGSAATLCKIGKRHAPDDPLHLARRLLDRGIVTMHNFLFGFPGETDADREASLDLIRRLRDLDAERIFFTFRAYQPLIGTPLGDEAVARSPDYPQSLEDVVRDRSRATAQDARTMPWLPAADEQAIRRLVFHYLPLVTSRLPLAAGMRAGLYRALRRVARFRLAKRWFDLPLDRWLFDRCVAGRLDNTFTP